MSDISQLRLSYLFKMSAESIFLQVETLKYF